jgi:nicotinamide mononucleotide transporter
MRRDNRETVIMVALTSAVSLIAFIMIWLNRTSWLEAISFVSGAICVWLTVKESVWNFPIGLINVTTFFVVFLQSHLFADAGLQIVYFVLGIVGWAMWLHGGVNRAPLRVSRAGTTELLLIVITGATLTLIFWQALHHVGGSASFWDAITTSISLCAQWMLNRKQLENWLGWILVDTIYVPLYTYKGLYLTAMLYAVFFVMAMMGWRAWRAHWLAARQNPVDESRAMVMT